MKANFFISALAAIFVISCGSEKVKEKENIKPGKEVTTAIPDTSAEPEPAPAEFSCKVNGQLFKYDEKRCIERPDFNVVEFNFFNGSEAVHVAIDIAEKSKTVPFTIELTAKDKTDSYFGFEPVPDIYSEPVKKNTITVTEWDQANKTISFSFNGEVTDVAQTRTFKMEGSAHKLQYE